MASEVRVKREGIRMAGSAALAVVEVEPRTVRVQFPTGLRTRIPERFVRAWSPERTPPTGLASDHRAYARRDAIGPPARRALSP
jgi:hypothetical protein